MDRHYKTSPFIKTAFVAIALAASSMSSAAQAEDFLATFSTQGLSELSLDVNPQALDANQLLTETLKNLERGICPDPEILRHIIRELNIMIINNGVREAAQIKVLDEARKAVTDQEAKIKAKKAEIKAAGEDSVKAVKLKDELKQLEATLGSLQLVAQEAQRRFNELVAKTKADTAARERAKELLKILCPEEVEDSKDSKDSKRL